MKKKIGIFILVMAAVGGCTFGCGGDASIEGVNEDVMNESEKSDKMDRDIENKSEDIIPEENKEMEKELSIELPEGFTVITERQFEKFQDVEGLTSAIDDALDSIGVQEIVDTVYGNYNAITTDIIFFDAYVITDLRKLVVRNNYLRGKWDVVYINDAESGNMYYPVTGKNAYDYIRGECINPDEGTDAELEKNLEELEDGYEEKDEPEKESKASAITFRVSELTFNDELITDVAMRDMTENDYIKDVYIEVDEGEKEIDIVVQVPSGTDDDVAKMAGEDVARYLAACASWVNERYKIPGSDDIGGIYDTYDLLIYVDDGLHNYDIYGAKVTAAKKITWR